MGLELEVKKIEPFIFKYEKILILKIKMKICNGRNIKSEEDFKFETSIEVAVMGMFTRPLR